MAFSCVNEFFVNAKREYANTKRHFGFLNEIGSKMTNQMKTVLDPQYFTGPYLLIGSTQKVKYHESSKENLMFSVQKKHSTFRI